MSEKVSNMAKRVKSELLGLWDLRLFLKEREIEEKGLELEAKNKEKS